MVACPQFQVLGLARAVLVLLLVAVALGLSNFAASIAIGNVWRRRGVARLNRARVRPVRGRVCRSSAWSSEGRSRTRLGSHAELVGGGLLVVTGAYTAVQASKDTHAAPSAMSVGLSLIGLELEQQLGVRVEHNGELFSGIVRMAVGVAIAPQACSETPVVYLAYVIAGSVYLPVRTSARG